MAGFLLYNKDMNELTKKAKEIAEKSHDGQLYGTGELYFTHLEQTARMAEKMGYCDEVIAACYLHDIVEDTNTTADDLLKVFPKPVVDAVIAVTFTGSNSDIKIKQAMSDVIGHVVKFCDASCNLSNAILNGPLHGKNYKEVVLKRMGYLAMMLPTLPTPEVIESYLLKSCGNG
jgi:hypothetical protein